MKLLPARCEECGKQWTDTEEAAKGRCPFCGSKKVAWER